jgi:hypothetical protein
VTDVVRSPEKVHALIDELPAMLARDPEMQPLVGFWPVVKPLVLGRLPEDPAQLDVVLETLAIWALRARSDDARGFIMRVDAGDVQARFLEQVDAAAAAPTNGGAPAPAADASHADDDSDSEFPDVPTEPMGPPLVPEDDEEA